MVAQSKSPASPISLTQVSRLAEPESATEQTAEELFQNAGKRRSLTGCRGKNVKKSVLSTRCSSMRIKDMKRGNRNRKKGRILGKMQDKWEKVLDEAQALASARTAAARIKMGSRNGR